jgi:hypothetical protein
LESRYVPPSIAGTDDDATHHKQRLAQNQLTRVLILLSHRQSHSPLVVDRLGSVIYLCFKVISVTD